MSEKYYNHYIEIMTSTMQDAIVRNISLQANSKVLEDIVNEQKAKLDELATNTNGSIDSLTSQLQASESSKRDLINQLNDANALRNEYEAVKSQAQHVDTFRNELVNARSEIEKLKLIHQHELENIKSNYKKQIEKLELKLSSAVIAHPARLTTASLTTSNTKNKITKVELKSKINADLLKDGGSF